MDCAGTALRANRLCQINEKRNRQRAQLSALAPSDFQPAAEHDNGEVRNENGEMRNKYVLALVLTRIKNYEISNNRRHLREQR